MIDQEETNIIDMAFTDEDSNKLTDWENPPTIMDLKQDFSDSKSDHDAKISRINTWLDNLNITGGAKLKKVTGKSNVQPKLIRKQAEWRYAALSEPFLSTPDIFNVEPITYEDKDSAVQNALVLNNQFNTKIDKIGFIDEYVRTAVNEGTVIVRTGWEEVEEEVTELIDVYDYRPNPTHQVNQLHQEIQLGLQEDPNYLATLPEHLVTAYELTVQNGIPVEPVFIETKEVTSTKVVKNQPTIEVCNNKNVYIDPSCLGDIDKAGFVIYSFETSKSELEKAGIYKYLDKINIDTSSILGEPDYNNPDDSSFNFKDEPRKKFVAYEYWGFWDIHGTGIVKPIVVTYVGDVIIRMEENPFPDGKVPFVVASYLPVKKTIYGEPDGELLIDNQKIIGAVTRGMVDIMARSANGQQATRKDALDVTNKRKFDKGLDYEFNSSVDPRQAFHMHTYPEIPQSASYMIDTMNADAESMSGVKAFSSGISGQALGSTATGIRSALDATSKRELGILNRLAEGIKRVGRKIISMNAEFLEEQEVVRITNDKFIPVRRDDLAGNFDLSLSISTAEADNQKAEELAFMLQTMGPNEDPGLRKIILSDIMRLRKMPTLAKKIESYEPQPDPVAEAMQRLELAKIEAEIEEIKSKVVENYAEAELDSAKTQEALVKSGNIQSDTDKKNLDFVEQESGVTQERELQKQGAQAKANAELEVTKAILNN